MAFIATVPADSFTTGEKPYTSYDIDSSYTNGIRIGYLLGVNASGKAVKADQANGIKAVTYVYEGSYSAANQFDACDLNPIPARYPIGARESQELGAFKKGAIIFTNNDGVALNATNSFRMKDATLTGTTSIAGTTAVVGVGTLFTTELKVGDYITIATEKRQVSVITNSTHLTVSIAFSGTSAGNAIVANSMYGEPVYLGDTSGTSKFSKFPMPCFATLKSLSGEFSQLVGWIEGKYIIRLNISEIAGIL